MSIRRRALLGAAAAGLAGPATHARAQRAWPERPIRLVLGFAPGGVGDFTARLIAPRLSEALGQAVVIDNRPGAGGIVSAEAVARAAPDGYTLLLLTTTNSTASALYKSLPYDVLRDFAPIARIATFDHVLLTGENSRFRSLEEVIAAARAKPGSINLGSIAVGNAQHLGAELFKTMAGVDMTIVTYRSTPDLVNATSTGEIDLASEILGPVLSQIEGKRLRPLAMTSAERYPLLPNVPTAHEKAVPGYVVGSWNGLAAPAGTPRAVVEKLHLAVKHAMADEAIRKKLLDVGVQPAVSGPEEFADFIQAENRRWAEIIERANIPKQ